MPARSSHSALKRRKELDRQRKAQMKLERRQNKKNAVGPEGAEQAEPKDESPTASGGEPAPRAPAPRLPD